MIVILIAKLWLLILALARYLDPNVRGLKLHHGKEEVMVGMLQNEIKPNAKEAREVGRRETKKNWHVIAVASWDTLLVRTSSQKRLISNWPYSKERYGYVEYHWVSSDSKRIYMGNECSIEVLSIDTYKLDMIGGRTLYHHNFLYGSRIRRNIFSITSM